MKRSIVKNFSAFCALDLSQRPVYPVTKYEMSQSALDAVLCEIFTVDPVSGLPKGDIAYFLSKDGNPQVKAWLESNLMQPRVAKGMADPAKVSDDLIVEMSRQPGETTDSYASRVMGIFDEAKANLAALQENNEPPKTD